MWRWPRWVVLGLASASAVWFGWDSHVRGVQQRSRDAVYEAKVDQLRKTYPVGTPRGKIVESLGQESIQISAGEVKVLLGTYPGDGFVCAKWNVYAQFVFGNAARIESEPLVRIQKTQSGLCL